MISWHLASSSSALTFLSSPYRSSSLRISRSNSASSRGDRFPPLRSSKLSTMSGSNTGALPENDGGAFGGIGFTSAFALASASAIALARSSSRSSSSAFARASASALRLYSAASAAALALALAATSASASAFSSSMPSSMPSTPSSGRYPVAVLSIRLCRYSVAFIQRAPAPGGARSRDRARSIAASYLASRSRRLLSNASAVF
mmetsp:Transcript_14972/g.58636  ORF Transcript_14972/g.58636 Transcript_14972/m.58636 type:complete len:204 (-) Transcript_14972:774-1385(-)